MTLFELGFVSLGLCGGLAGSYFGYARHGWMGAVVGAVAGSGGIFFVVEGMGWLESVWRKYHPAFPVCRNGVCQAADYKSVESRQGHPIWQCKCGTNHIFVGRRFLEVLPDGTFRPFMNKRRLGGWEHELG